MTRFALLGLCLAALANAGCTGNAFGSGSSGDADVAKERIRELQGQARETEAELEELRGRVAELESALGEATAEAKRPPTPPEPEISFRPPGEIEESDLPPAYDLDTEPGSAQLTAASRALYDRGYELFHRRRYVDAESTFQQFLQANPGSDLADNAQYWIGECRFARKDYAGALAGFRETLERYPDGNKVSDALLKVGRCLEEQGDYEGARVTYEEVLDRFPDSSAAAKARGRQENLP